MKALKWLILIPVMGLMSFIGCANQSSWAGTYTPESITPSRLPAITQPAQPTRSQDAMPEPPMYSNWLSPAKVTISNFHSGAVAEYPITFHNAKQITTDQKQVTTEDKETIAEIPLNSAGLYQDDIANVTGITSNNPNEQLRVTAYDKKVNSLMISGFLPNTTRILTMTYKPMTAYSVYFRYPDVGAPSESVKIAHDWVIVADPTLVMSPLETTNDMVSISMPSDAKVPDSSFEFWIGVTENTKAGGTALSIELVSRWIVNMKQS
jgi:hypothetical protein